MQALAGTVGVSVLVGVGEGVFVGVVVGVCVAVLVGVATAVQLRRPRASFGPHSPVQHWA